MPIIDRNSPIPLYYQLKQILLEKITEKQWAVGDMIPSENELQEIYGVSRTTIRQTLTDLVNEGHLIRQQGRGTFVAANRQKYAHSPASQPGLTEYLQTQGITPGWHVIETEEVSPPQAVRQALQLDDGATALAIRRLRLADDEPIGSHVAYIPDFIAAKIDEDALAVGESLRYLAHLPRMKASHAERTIEALPADPDDTALLGIEVNRPILQIERLIIASDGTPIEHLIARYRGDRFSYKITL